MRYLLLVLLLTGGCGHLIPTSRMSSTGVGTSEAVSTQQNLTVESVVRTIGPGMTYLPESVTSSNLPPLTEKVMTIRSASTAQAADKASANDNSKVVIPLWVNLMGFALALLALLFAVRMIRKQYAAFDAAVDLADKGFASVINNLRTQAMSSPDPHTMASLNATIAHLESERGKFNSNV